MGGLQAKHDNSLYTELSLWILYRYECLEILSSSSSWCRDGDTLPNGAFSHTVVSPLPTVSFSVVSFTCSQPQSKNIKWKIPEINTSYGFKLPTILSSMTKSCPFCPVWDVSHPFVHTGHAPHPPVTYELSQSSDHYERERPHSCNFYYSMLL